MQISYIRYFYLATAVMLGGLATIAKLQCRKSHSPPVIQAHSNTTSVEFFNAGRSVAHLDEYEMRVFMREYGFRKLHNVRLPMLRRIYLAYNYRQMYRDMAIATGLEENIIFSIHIFESTINGVETDLFAEHKNPGGIKYRGQGYKVLWFDDCTDLSGTAIPCEFEGFATYQDMLSAWSYVLNADRYSPCKGIDKEEATCYCLQEAGYHTANSYRQRAGLAKQYTTFQKYFPVP